MCVRACVRACVRVFVRASVLLNFIFGLRLAFHHSISHSHVRHAGHVA